MAAEVSSFARMLGRYVEENREVVPDGRRDLVTRDFLGGGGGGGVGCYAAPSAAVKELDLELAAPAGWERRLDLTSGEVFLQRTGPSTAPSGVVVSSDLNQNCNPPPLLPLFPSPTLDLATLPPPSAEYQSVCTLDKVKSALDRLATAAPAPSIKPARPNNPSHSSSPSASRSASCSASCSPSESLSRSASPTSSSITASSKQKHRRQSREPGDSETTTQEDGPEPGAPAAMVATGCPTCLSYVLISRIRPRCPRCAANIPPPLTKKPRLDLNLNSSSSPAAAGGRCAL